MKKEYCCDIATCGNCEFADNISGEVICREDCPCWMPTDYMRLIEDAGSNE